MSFTDKTKDAVKKFKDNDNEQVKNIKDKINGYAGSSNEEKKEDKDKGK